MAWLVLVVSGVLEAVGPRRWGCPRASPGLIKTALIVVLIGCIVGLKLVSH